LWRVWRGYPFRSKVPANAQVGGILSLFDYLVACPRLPRCFLLRANVVIQLSVTGFKLASRSRYIFFYRGKLRLDSIQLLLCQTHCIRAAQACAYKFCTLFGESRSPRCDVRGSSFNVRRWRIERMQIRELFQEIAIRSFALLNPAFHAGKLALAHIEIVLRLALLLEKRLLVCLQLCKCLSLFAGILFPFFFNPFYSFFAPRDSKCDFLLLLLQFLQRNDFVA